jgi:hypothetical protein
MAVESFGTNRDDIQGNRFKKLKMKTGDELRCGVLYFDKSGDKIFLGAPVHVKPKTKTFLCKSTDGNKEICCTHSWEGNNPHYHIGCIIIIYDLGKENGKIKLKGYELMPWFFWETMYRKLVNADSEFPLTKHDLKLKCTNDEYSTIDIQSCKESIWSGSENLKKKILEEAKPMFENISKNLGADLSISEIKELIGIEITGSDDAAADVDLGAVVDTLE